MISLVLMTLIALSLPLTFFGKSMIGFGMVFVFIVSLFILATQTRLSGQIKILRHDLYFRRVCFIIAIIGALSLSSYFGIQPHESFQKLAEFTAIAFAGYVIYQAVQKTDFKFSYVFKIVTLSLSCFGVLLLMTPYLGAYKIGWVNHYGSVIAILFPMAFILALTETKRNYIWFICMAIIIASVVASNGRTAWVALSINIIIMMAYLLTHTIRHKIRLFLVSMLVIGIGLFSGLHCYKQFFGEDMLSARTKAMMSTDRPASGRLEIWNAAIDKIYDRPWLGYGIKAGKNLKISLGSGGEARHVHNIVIELILETGIIGFGLLSLAVLILIWRYLNVYAKTATSPLKMYAFALFISFVTYGVCSMALTSIFHTWWFLYLVVLLVLMKTMEAQLKNK